jgi:hypothetical protein
MVESKVLPLAKLLTIPRVKLLMPSAVLTVGGNQSVEELRRELAEAREQQTATADILRVISSSPTDLQRVFAEIAMLSQIISVKGSMQTNRPTQKGNPKETTTMSTTAKPPIAPNPADVALMGLVMPLVSNFMQAISKLPPDERMRRINRVLEALSGR